MNTEQLLLLCNGGLLGIVGYFLTKTMNKLEQTSDKADKNSEEIELVKQRHDLKQERWEEKFDELKLAVIELTLEMRKSNEKNLN